jgi:hypothetical protein
MVDCALVRLSPSRSDQTDILSGAKMVPINYGTICHPYRCWGMFFVGSNVPRRECPSTGSRRNGLAGILLFSSLVMHSERLTSRSAARINYL